MSKKSRKKLLKKSKDKRLLKKSIAALPQKDRNGYWIKGYAKQQGLDK